MGANDCYFPIGVSLHLSYRFGTDIGHFEAAEFTPSLLRAHVTARELASPPFEDVYIRACADQVTLNQRRI